jgi:hypothetical protein
MPTVDASFTRPGPEIDALRAVVEPTPEPWGAEVIDEEVIPFRAFYEPEELTDRLAGREIVGLLDFDLWGDLPETELPRHLPPWQPQPLADLLKKVPSEVSVRAEFPALVRH